MLEQNFEFPTVYGISAGACNALSFISKQQRRNYEIFYRYIRDERYISIASLYRTGSLFGFDFIFGELFHNLLPFDYKAFQACVNDDSLMAYLSEKIRAF